MKIRELGEKYDYIIELSHKELVLLSCSDLDLEYINSQLFDKDEFKTKDSLLKKYAKIYHKINKALRKVDVF